MTLYVVLNADGTLALESDYTGVRVQVATDSPDGPTEWVWHDSWNVPQRTENLVATAIETAEENANLGKAIDINKDATVGNFVDDR